mmetsp:Transcript_51299/g.123440  ORF Transcript_51299/g.123440 Transcript_51299/m.123440 type:complete len:201 (-) Transcript_51299:1455-2057(-)
MEMLMNLPSLSSMPLDAPSFSTSGVGSTPGNRTKKMGVAGDDSSYVPSMSNGSSTTYFSPILSCTNVLSAAVTRSGRSARRMSSFSNGVALPHLPGILVTSGFSLSNQPCQSSESVCMSSPSDSTLGICSLSSSSAFTLGHSASGIQSDSGPMLPGSDAVRPSTSAATPSCGSSPARTSTLRHSCVAMVSLSRSNRPRRR